MARPKELYYVEVKTAPGDGLHYREKGGGKFTNLDAARDRRDDVLSAHPTADVRVYRTSTEWVEVVE